MNIIITDQPEKLTMNEKANATLIIETHKSKTAKVSKNRHGASGFMMETADIHHYLKGYLAAALSE